MKTESTKLEHEGEAPAPGSSDKKYDAEAKKGFKAISDRVGKHIEKRNA